MSQEYSEDILKRMTTAMREADATFERTGGSTRHHIRECLMPILAKHGLRIDATTDGEVRQEYSPDNWAHQALLKMDEAEALVRFAATHMPDINRYKRASQAFWNVCHMLVDERAKQPNPR